MRVMQEARSARLAWRAQNLAVEHTEVAQMNMRLALERRAESEQVMPAIRLVVG
jgi:GntR family transcriptional regulator of vanillate catabolism